MKYLLLTCAAFFLITGCASAPKETSEKLTLGLVQSTVTKGANQSEITKVLGAPNIISRDKQGNETWTYDRISRQSVSGSTAGIGVGGIFGWLFGVSKSTSSSSSSSSQSSKSSRASRKSSRGTRITSSPTRARTRPLAVSHTRST